MAPGGAGPAARPRGGFGPRTSAGTGHRAPPPPPPRARSQHRPAQPWPHCGLGLAAWDARLRVAPSRGGISARRRWWDVPREQVPSPRRLGPPVRPPVLSHGAASSLLSSALTSVCTFAAPTRPCLAGAGRACSGLCGREPGAPRAGLPGALLTRDPAVCPLPLPPPPRHSGRPGTAPGEPLA